MRRARTHSVKPLATLIQGLRSRSAACEASLPVIIPLTLLLMLACAAPATAQRSSWLHAEYRTGDFKLVAGTHAADIFVAPDDYKVAQIAANDLAEDVARVTGRRPE